MTVYHHSQAFPCIVCRFHLWGLTLTRETVLMRVTDYAPCFWLDPPCGADGEVLPLGPCNALLQALNTRLPSDCALAGADIVHARPIMCAHSVSEPLVVSHRPMHWCFVARQGAMSH